MSDAGDFAEGVIADWLGANATPSAMPNVYLKLHVGAPGEAGTANAAGETDRMEATFGAQAGGVVSLAATVTWLAVSTAETYTHVSLWNNPTAGNHILNGTLSAPVAVGIGDDFDLTAFTVTVT